MNNKKNLILEGLQFRRDQNKDFSEDMLGDILTESIEFESMWSDVSREKLDEAKAVTFGGKSYPKSGWMLVMAGGAGSGKGFTIDKQVLMDAKIVDVDAMKTKFAKVSARGGDTAIANRTGGKTFDFKNSDDVSDLHATIGTELELDSKAHANLIASQGSGSTLTNLIFDITGKSSTKLMNLALTGKKLGYKTSLLWVVTNRQVAMMRNLLRDRVVGERLFHEIHNQVNKVLLDYLQSSDAKDYDEAWIVFSGSSEVSDLPKAARDELFNNSAYKLTKSGDSFIINPDLMSKVIEFLGPQEESPNKPQTYKGFNDVKNALEPYKGKNNKPQGYTKLNFMAK